MKIDILTLFPEMFIGPFDHSIIKRASDKGLVEIAIYNLRDWATDKHRSVDDKPYGGGKGMMLRVDVIDRAIQKIKNQKSKTILLTPQGKIFNQRIARKLAKEKNIILICGHYEGFDERVRSLADEEISIGKYILTGGELPAMVITDTIARLIPGVLPEGVTNEETFSMRQATNDKQQGKEIEYPQYTFPREYKGMKVPEVLLSGNHAQIKKWKIDKTK